MMQRKKSFRLFIEYFILRFFTSIFSAVPFRLRASFWEQVTLAGYYIASGYRNKVLTNLRYGFPDQTEEWRVSIAKKNFRILGRQFAEFMETPYITDSFFQKWFVAEPSAQIHKEAYSKGGMCILGHFGNWEWHGYFAGKLSGRDIFTLVKRHSNPWSNQYFEKTRNSSYMQLIYIDQNPFITINKLRKGELVAFTSDQNAGSSGEYFPFFGRLASTYLGPASVARNTSCPIYFVWSWHDEKGRLHFELEELKRPDFSPREDVEKWEHEFTYMWVKKMEEKVKQHPADYLWTHNRWKSQPENPDEIWKRFPA